MLIAELDHHAPRLSRLPRHTLIECLQHALPTFVLAISLVEKLASSLHLVCRLRSGIHHKGRSIQRIIDEDLHLVRRRMCRVHIAERLLAPCSAVAVAVNLAHGSMDNAIAIRQCLHSLCRRVCRIRFALHHLGVGSNDLQHYLLLCLLALAGFIVRLHHHGHLHGMFFLLARVLLSHDHCFLSLANQGRTHRSREQRHGHP